MRFAPSKLSFFPNVIYMYQTYELNVPCVLAHMDKKQAWIQHGKHVKQIQACNPRGLQTSHYTQRAHITIWAVFWGGRLLLYLMFEFSFIHFVVNVIPLFCAVYFPHFICPNYTFALNPLTHPLIKRIIILLIHKKWWWNMLYDFIFLFKMIKVG